MKNRQIPAALRAGGLFYRREFGKIPAEDTEVTLNGNAYVNASGLVFPGTGVDYGSVDIQGLGLFSDSVTVSVRFTPDFAANEAVTRSLISAVGVTRYFVVQRNSNGAIYIYMGSSSIMTIAAVSWQPYWVQGSENILTLHISSGSNTAWLNGTQIATYGNTFNFDDYKTLVFGAYSGTQIFKGVIHSVEFYRGEVELNDVLAIERQSILSDIEISKSLIHLPCDGSYVRSSDSKRVTRAEGVSGIREVLLGSDGVTAAQFPSDVYPRGFNFDGGDQINCGDDDDFSFTDGSNDLPFSFACLNSAASSGALISKYISGGASEFLIAHSTLGSTRGEIFYLFDNVNGGNIARYNSTFSRNSGAFHVSVYTYDGSALISGIRIYRDGYRVDTGNISGGSYARMRNTASPLSIGASSDLVSWKHTGDIIAPTLFDFELSPMQVKALSYEIRNRSVRP